MLPSDVFGLVQVSTSFACQLGCMRQEGRAQIASNEDLWGWSSIQQEFINQLYPTVKIPILGWMTINHISYDVGNISHYIPISKSIYLLLLLVKSIGHCCD